MLHEHDKESKLNWPDECQTIISLTPLLFSGMSGNRSTLHHLIKSTDNLKSDLSCGDMIKLPDLKSEKLHLMQSKVPQDQIGHGLKGAQNTIIHSKKLHDELLMPLIIQSQNIDKDKINKQQDLPDDAQHAKSNPLPKKSKPKRNLERIKECLYTFDSPDSKKVSSASIKNEEMQHEKDQFLDDRYFSRSYYNRKNERDIYSKPPNMRRVLLNITANDPEYGINQNWITSWEPTDDFINRALKDVSLKSSNHSQKRKTAQNQSRNQVKKTDHRYIQNQKLKDSYIPYSLPKRQEYKRLDIDFVARLVEIQTGHLAHHQRQMRPTLGVPKLQNKKKLINIGPSMKHTKHNYLNEDPDDLELALQICNLSLEENSFTEDLSNLTEKLELSCRRAANKRKKNSSHLFRNIQSNVESIIDSDIINIRQALRSKMEKFLIASRKHQIFLDTISIDYNPWEKNVEVTS